jgi:hypothetical protein
MKHLPLAERASLNGSADSARHIRYTDTDEWIERGEERTPRGLFSQTYGSIRCHTLDNAPDDFFLECASWSNLLGGSKVLFTGVEGDEVKRRLTDSILLLRSRNIYGLLLLRGIRGGQ